MMTDRAINRGIFDAVVIVVVGFIIIIIATER